MPTYTYLTDTSMRNTEVVFEADNVLDAYAKMCVREDVPEAQALTFLALVAACCTGPEMGEWYMARDTLCALNMGGVSFDVEPDGAFTLSCGSYKDLLALASRL